MDGKREEHSLEKYPVCADGRITFWNPPSPLQPPLWDSGRSVLYESSTHAVPQILTAITEESVYIEDGGVVN